MTAFTEIAIILAVTFGISIIMRILKQPLIIGYIFSGIIAGPYVLNVIHSQEIMELLSKIGITALLFIVGLGLSPKVLKETGLAAGATGFGQIFFTTLITYFSATALGFNSLESFYIALSFGFSSTIIILKLLSDKGDTHKLYGRVAVGFLLVEDLVATIALVIISGISNIGNGSIIDIISKLGVLLGTGFVLLIILFLFSTHVLSRLNNFVSKSQEFLFIFSLAWGLTIAMIYQKLGLSIEIGALVAGVTLSMTPYSYEISARLKPLRDFFILMFFILLGSHMAFGNINQLLLPALILSTIILFGKPLAIFVIMNLLGFTRKNAFLSGLVAAQISEFSLILVTLGNSIGHVSNQALSLVTLVGIFTISGSTYLVMFNEA
ncbi:MAG: cation:proton antiporter, partial [Proteobacteria bacterium]|nr:cation:proton antiporter [Pseudomonadota bacterium]